MFGEGRASIWELYVLLRGRAPWRLGLSVILQALPV